MIWGDGSRRGCCGFETLAETKRASIDLRSKPRAAVPRCVESLARRVSASGRGEAVMKTWTTETRFAARGREPLPQGMT